MNFDQSKYKLMGTQQLANALTNVGFEVHGLSKAFPHLNERNDAGQIRMTMPRPVYVYESKAKANYAELINRESRFDHPSDSERIAMLQSVGEQVGWLIFALVGPNRTRDLIRPAAILPLPGNEGVFVHGMFPVLEAANMMEEVLSGKRKLITQYYLRVELKEGPGLENLDFPLGSEETMLGRDYVRDEGNMDGFENLYY